MDAWADFWRMTFIIAMAIFAVVTVAVSVGGFFDVLAMFRQINRQHENRLPESSADDE